MAYTIRLGKLVIKCDTFAELEAALQSDHVKTAVPINKIMINRAEKEQKRIDAIRQSWLEAAEYADKHGITKVEARKKLAKDRRKK